MLHCAGAQFIIRPLDGYLFSYSIYQSTAWKRKNNKQICRQALINAAVIFFNETPILLHRTAATYQIYTTVGSILEYTQSSHWAFSLPLS